MKRIWSASIVLLVLVAARSGALVAASTPVSPPRCASDDVQSAEGHCDGEPAGMRLSQPSPTPTPCTAPDPSSTPCATGSPRFDPTPYGGIPSGNTFVVDADATVAGIQPSIVVSVGASFTISSVLTAAPDPYQAYQSNIAYDGTILATVNGSGHRLGFAALCAHARISDASLDRGPYLYDGCAQSDTQSDTGATVDYSLTCIAPGTSALHLQTAGDVGPGVATNFALADGVLAAATTIDASVTCVDIATPGSLAHDAGN